MEDVKRLLLGIVVVVAVGWWWYASQTGKTSTNSNGNTSGSAQSDQRVTTTTPSIYIVQRGEGLWNIAQKELGSGFKWVEIAKENNLSEPYILEIGQELKIPGKVTETVTQQERTYTLAQVAEHAERDNCWLAIDSKVYDVTPFVASGFHPGKTAILEGCGKDATTLFNTRPMGTGTSHSQQARQMLPKYLIGNLVQN